MLKSIALACATLITVAGFPATAQVNSIEDDEAYWAHIDSVRDVTLDKMRQSCADGDMPGIKRRLDANWEKRKNIQSINSKMPDVHVYCLKVLETSKAKGRMTEMYINIALQEQGYGRFHFAEQAALLKNNEAGRTWEAITHAANAGQTSYTSFNGKSRDLPCSLALDAGVAWAARSSKAVVPLTLTRAQATEAARQCYAPGVATISLGGKPLPATKAGLIIGAWFGKN